MKFAFDGAVGADAATVGGLEESKMTLGEDRKKQILIVEDEGLIAADICGKLEQLGYRSAAIASSGEDALRRARSTEFDLVLMDIRLEGELDGIATAQTFKDEMRIPVVYMTALSDPATLDRAKDTGPYGYLCKPVTEGALSSAVEIALQKHALETCESSQAARA
jgi:CheY-like chemotaxis protein